MCVVTILNSLIAEFLSLMTFFSANLISYNRRGDFCRGIAIANLNRADIGRILRNAVRIKAFFTLC